MKSATVIVADPDEMYFRGFDLRDIDSSCRYSMWRTQYLNRIGTVLDAIRLNVPKGGTVLEIGSAQANMSLLLAEEGYRTTAVDLALSALTYSRKKYEFGDMRWYCGNAFDMVHSQVFDAVILGELVEHVAEPKALISQAWQMVAPSGLLLITTPNGEAVNSCLPSFHEVSRDKTRLFKDQFGPGGEHHLFALTMRELLAFAPQDARIVACEYIVSLLVNRRTEAILKFSLGRMALRWLADVVQLIPQLRAGLNGTLLLVLAKTTA